MAAPAAAPSQQQSNASIRRDILARSIPILQPVKSGNLGSTYVAGQPLTVNTQANPVGLIRRFWLEITGTVNCAATHTLTPSMFGLANLLSNVQYTDQNNRLRINTTGIHLHLSSTQRRKRPFGGAYVASTGISDPTGMGANYPVQQGTGTVTGGTAKTFTFMFEIPVVNSNTDLTGAVYANQVTSNNQIQFTINPAFFAATATDAYNSGYVCDAAIGTTLPTLTGLTWNLYQDYLDQFQQPNGSVILPPDDISIALMLQILNPGQQIAGQDNLYPLPPFNIYQNIMAFWDNYTYNTAPLGSDVQYLKVQISNSYVLKQFDVLLAAVQCRNTIGTDFPAVMSSTQSGQVINLDFRHKPLLVNQLSATNIVFRPTAVQANASLMYGQEYLWKAGSAGG